MAPTGPTARVATGAALAAAALGAPLAVLWWMARPIYPFVEDDALISLRYARRLLDGDGLTWTTGETVEGYSNLLWVLLTAALGAFGMDLIDAARVLGVASIAGCLWALLHQARVVERGEREGGQARPWPAPMAAMAALVAGLLLCASGPIALWSIAGLEQPLVAALLMWAAAAAMPLLLGPHAEGQRRSPARSRDAFRLGVPLSLLVWTRPDSPLFVALFALALALGGPGNRSARIRLAVRVTVLPLSAWAVQLGLRLLYHGDFLPNPAYLKAGLSPDRFGGGVDYLLAGVRYLWPLLLLASVAAIDGLRDGRRRGYTALLLSCALVWSLYVAAIGGDHFPGHRHLVVVVALCCALIAAALATLPQRSGHRATAPLVALVLAASAFGHAKLQQRDPDYVMGIRARWQWDGKALGELFARAFQDAQPLWAVTAAGCMPYFSGLPALDMLGLNDRHIAKTPRDPSMPLAHDHGDGGYVLDRAPDLITFGLPTGGPPVYLSGVQMRRDPRFARDYRPVTFRVFEPHVVTSTTYVRVEGRAGIVRGAGALRYPAYLLSGAVGQPLPDGRLGARLPARAAATTVELSLPPGHHRIALSPDTPLLGIDARVIAGDVRAVAGPEPGLHVVTAARVQLSLRSTGTETLLHGLELRRVGAAAPPPEAEACAVGGRTVLRAPGPDVDDVTAPLLSIDFESAAAGVQRHGAAMVVTAGAAPGQRPIAGAHGKLLNSFVAGLGDRGTGVLFTEPFTATEGSVLQLRIGGGLARDFHSQVGVAITEGTRVLQVLTGRNSEQLVQRRLDMSAFAGRELRIEVFDRARGPWGHVLVDELRVLR